MIKIIGIYLNVCMCEVWVGFIVHVCFCTWACSASAARVEKAALSPWGGCDSFAENQLVVSARVCYISILFHSFLCPFTHAKLSFFFLWLHLFFLMFY